MMKVDRLVVGAMEVNCYLVIDEETKQAAVIDPGAQADKILDAIEAKELDVQYVINTHGHIDHIAANPEILTATGSQLLIHEEDADFLTNPELNLSVQVGQGSFTSPAADRLLTAGDKVEWGEISLEVICTPVLSPGGLCLIGEGVIFSGDTLFAMGVGRTDFPQGSQEKLNQSLDKISTYGDDLKLYPGHGPTSTLGKVKNQNIYL
jgi:glyoxylase-like metal-dependent hydrolase (beta-lactamase superfamily II)